MGDRMNDKVDQSAAYYELLARKHEQSGRGPNQARVYRELVALVRQCSSLEEIQSRMKAGGYYESPAQALVLDKLLAHRDAAAELGFHRLAAIYQQQHDAVAADYRAAWNTGWEQQAKQELHRIGNVVGAFNDLMSGYYGYRCSQVLSWGESIEAIRAAARAIEAAGETVDGVVGNPYYRRHCPLDDDRYQAAVATIRWLLTSDPDPAAAEADWRARTQAVVDAGDESRLRQLQQQYEAGQRRSVNLCVAPDDQPGPYTREPFYEGKL
jgi:hypothetical protein